MATWTPESVETSRRLAQRLIGQGTDISPVGHWTQALARALQGGSGAAWMDQANAGEAAGRQRVGDIYKAGLEGGQPVNRIAAQLMGDPFGFEAGQKMAQGYLTRDPLDAQIKQAKLDEMRRSGPLDEAYKRAQIERMQRDDTKYAAGPNFVYNTRTGDVSPLPQEARKDGPLEAAVAKETVEMASNDIKAAYGAQDVRSSAEKLREYAKDKRLEGAIGPIAGTSAYQTIVGGIVPFSQTLGLAAPDLNRNIDQIKSSIVLAAQQKMKGMGSVSDADSARVEKAVGLLERARNKREFMDAIAEIERSVDATIQRGQIAAQQFPQLGGRLNVAPQRSTPQISQQQVLSEAQAAIAKGAPRDQVIKRLRDMGINTDGM